MPGFSLLEFIVVMLLVSVMTLLAIPSYQTVYYRILLQQDIAQLRKAVHTAQQQSLARLSPVTLCSTAGCERPLERALVLQSKDSVQEVPLSGHNRIYIQAFPAYRAHALRFAADGLLDAQNASIYFCSNQRSLGEHWVVNAAGRLQVKSKQRPDFCD